MNHLVALSGGKDSTAMSLRLKELYPEIDFTFFCTPTGDELPIIKEHWKNLSVRLGKKIIEVHHPEYQDIYQLIRDKKMLPNHQKRFCTAILKIEATENFYIQHWPAIIYVGLRADEEHRKGNTGLQLGIKQKYPLREWGWGIEEVREYLTLKGIKIPRRTDCAMCFFQRIGEWWLLWHEYPEIFKRISDLEDEINHTLMNPKKHKIWPSKLSELAEEFKSGRKPREISKGIQREQCIICKL